MTDAEVYLHGMPRRRRRVWVVYQITEGSPGANREAFRRGSWGVGQDLRVLTRPWGFDLGSITVPTSIHHGDADTTVPLQHARGFAEAIPGAPLHIHPGHGHFSILALPRHMLATLAG
jgi:pimeloyl-ACP methyl ester carboxylesterase